MSGPTIAAMRARLGSGYAHLQSMRTCDKSASTSKETGITKMDAKLVSTFKMFENASRIEDAVQVIDDAVRLMCDGDASMNKRKQMARNLKLIVSPMLSSVVVDINEAAKSLAPIAGVPESHRKREVTRKRDAESYLLIHCGGAMLHGCSTSMILVTLVKWSMRMAYKNMSVVAALMVLQSHVKMDIGSLNEQDCLLAIDLSQFVDCSECPDREGAYLYFDLNRGVFVRSGKVSGRGFGARNGEHLSAAKASSATSFFYLMFPSASSPRFSKRDKRGSFESLKQVVASGFDGRSEAAKYVDRDVSEGGVLLQMELGYDIALSPDSNVSRSPGFETVLGVISDE